MTMHGDDPMGFMTAPPEGEGTGTGGMPEADYVHDSADEDLDVRWAGGTPELRNEIRETLRTIYDPEIPVNIYDLGLIYRVHLDDAGGCQIEMTLTAPGCPVAGPLVEEVESKAGMVPGISVSRVELVFDPPWTMDRMTEGARLSLGMF